jgi:type II secretory pathway pseudopilin PulG
MMVVLGVIAIMMAFTYPAYLSISERAKVTKDMSNLRQIGAATQMYMNDNNGVFPGSATTRWMSQLNQKYLSSWRVLESPFDKRTTSELGNATTAISYGINSNVYSGGVAISADKITKPVTFIVFSPAQKDGNTVSFSTSATATAPAPGVTEYAGTSNPGAAAIGGTSNNRTKINAICADWHAETMLWSDPLKGPAFINTSDPGKDADAQFRWCPQPPCP